MNGPGTISYIVITTIENASDCALTVLKKRRGYRGD